MSKNSLFSKLNKRYSDSRTQLQTSRIIDDIFDLLDGNYKNNSKINAYMHELKLRGSDAVYEYYVKYVRRVLDEEIEFERINVYYALNEVLKLNEAEKIWDFVNLLQDLKSEHNFTLHYEKCSRAMANTGNIKFNLTWAEVYKDYNQPNIETVLNSNDSYSVARMVALVSNLTDEQIKRAVAIVKKSKDNKAKSELKQILKDKKELTKTV